MWAAKMLEVQESSYSILTYHLQPSNSDGCGVGDSLHAKETAMILFYHAQKSRELIWVLVWVLELVLRTIKFRKLDK